VNAGTAIIPNLDAIAEFRIVTSNFDAEYGEFSAAARSASSPNPAATRSTAAFNFLRNTDLDARNYFSPTRGASARTSSAAPSAAPSVATRSSSSLTTRERVRPRASTPASIPVPSNAERAGNLLDFTTGPGGNQLTGAVRKRPVLRQPAQPEARLYRQRRRTVLPAWLHAYRRAFSPTPSFPSRRGRFPRSACCNTSPRPTPRQWSLCHFGL
jgi:hypothetical protein